MCPHVILILSCRSHALSLQPPRYGVDEWDEMMMERDRRLTGSLRGQKVSKYVSHALYESSPSARRYQSDPTPPEGFATNSTYVQHSIEYVLCGFAYLTPSSDGLRRSCDDGLEGTNFAGQQHIDTSTIPPRALLKFYPFQFGSTL